MILTKMLSGVSLGTTLREPLGKSAETILRRRLEEKERRAQCGVCILFHNLQEEKQAHVVMQ